MLKPTALVIGAGIGGIATAARLAKNGYEVTVLEKESTPGGRCNQIVRNIDDAGFEGIEMQTIANPDEAAEILAATKTTGLRIHSVMYADHWSVNAGSVSAHCTTVRFPCAKSEVHSHGGAVAALPFGNP